MNKNRPRLGFLLVGAGDFGARRGAAIACSRRARLSAVTDVDATRARRLATRLGADYVGSLEEGLERTDVEAVAVATPPADHHEVAMSAIDAGKHVLCEKPLAISTGESKALALQADLAGVRLGTGFNHRFYPPIRDALELAGSWAIGRIRSLRVEIGHVAGREFLRGWHADVRRSGGGTLIDNGPHACDLARRFLGEFVGARGCLDFDADLPEACEMEAFGLLRNHQGAIVEIHSSWDLREGYLSIDLRGTAGRLRAGTAPWRLHGSLANGGRIDRRYLYERAREKLHRLRFGCESSLAAEVDDFSDLESEFPRQGGSGWDGARATEIIQAIYLSARVGEEVELHPYIASRRDARSANVTGSARVA